MLNTSNLARSASSACFAISVINILQGIYFTHPVFYEEQSAAAGTAVEQSSPVGADERGVSTAATTSATVLTPQDEQAGDPQMDLPEQNIMVSLHNN